MKKLIALMLIAVLMISTAACSNSDDKENVNEEANVSDTQDPAGVEDEVQDEDADSDEEKDQASEDKKEEVKNEANNEDKQEQAAPSASVAQTLLADFKACAGGSSPQAIADRLLQNEVIQFSGGTMAVEPGLLTGFGNAEITGFSEGVMFAPAIGTIPFVGYIFVLDEGTDASAFMSTLKSNADQRWNICTAAEETVVSNVGNKVFFVMSPKSFEN